MGKTVEEKVQDTLEQDAADTAVIESPMPEEGPANLHERVKVKISNKTPKDKPPYQKHGEVVEMHPAVAKKFEANGWGKVVATVFLFLAFSFGALAQGTANQHLAKVVSNLPTTAYKLITSDTVTNTGTNYLTSGYPQSGSTYSGSPVAIVNPAYYTTVQVNITKISGTVAGTVTLQGSIDGTNFSTATSGMLAITATYTATDVASQSKNWIIAGNPYRFYRVSWTGTGTMAASMTANIWSH